jgi:hypothetical protein
MMSSVKFSPITYIEPTSRFEQSDSVVNWVAVVGLIGGIDNGVD